MKKEFKKLLKKNFSKEHELYLASKYKLTRVLNSFKETPKRMGDKNPDKTFYIISADNETGGLFCWYLGVLEEIYYAISNNWVPVIKSSKGNQYYDKEKGENIWEYYFEQPYNISIKEAMQSSKVIQGCGFHFISGLQVWLGSPYSIRRFLKDPQIRNICYEIADKYLKMNKEVLNYANNKYQELIHIQENFNSKIMGVICRGTDYTSLKPNSHLIQPNPLEVIEKATESMELWGYDRIFLATEDKNIYDAFRKRFGVKLLHSQKIHFVDTENKYLAKVTIPENKYDLGLQYLTSIYILSRCDALMGGLVGGTMGALIMNGGRYEHTYFWDLGVYGTDD